MAENKVGGSVSITRSNVTGATARLIESDESTVDLSIAAPVAALTGAEVEEIAIGSVEVRLFGIGFSFALLYNKQGQSGLHLHRASSVLRCGGRGAHHDPHAERRADHGRAGGYDRQQRTRPRDRAERRRGAGSERLPALAKHGRQRSQPLASSRGLPPRDVPPVTFSGSCRRSVSA